MTRYMKILYIIVFLCLGILMVYYGITYRNDTIGNQKDKTFEILSCTEEIRLSDEETDGDTKYLKIPVENVSGDHCHLFFYSIHQRVEVYCELKKIYSMWPAKRNTFTKTPGCVWNDISLDESMNGKELYVVLKSVYKGVSYETPTFYLGNQGAIYRSILRQEGYALFISVLLLLMGVFFLCYVFYNYGNAEMSTNYDMLGLCAVLVGMWKISDASISKLFFDGKPVVSLIPFLCLLLFAVPAIRFYMGMCHATENRNVQIACVISLAICIILFVLQYFGWLDLRQAFPVILLNIILAFGTMGYMVFREFREYGLSNRLKLNLVGFVFIFVGVILDLFSYFTGVKNRITAYGITIFFCYIMVYAIKLIIESGSLIKASKTAEVFENLAYHDKLTGLYNRSAFIVDTDPYAVQPDDYVVVVLDLNNLKQCNDTYGHSRGDEYIKASARIIQSTFGSIGTCYRMGGDEFYCLIPTGGLSACRTQKDLMEDLIAEFNAQSPDVQMGIACGMARYDSRMDYDLNVTAKRADKMMYSNKVQMKSSRGGESSADEGAGEKV